MRRGRKVRAPQGRVPGNAWEARAYDQCNREQTADGPFAETKEQLGGYYILDCDNLDEAIEYAAKIPTAAFGSIEVRPIMVFD